MAEDKIESALKLEYNIDKDDFIKAGEASSNIKKFLTKKGFDPKLVRKVAISTYESEMNIIIHSYGGKITVNIIPEYIEVIAEDNGPGIENIDLTLEEGYSTASEKAREMGFGAGMGLPNIKKFCDEFRIESQKGGSTKLYMKFLYNIS